MPDILGLQRQEPPRYDNLVAGLIREFPELKAALERELTWWGSDEPGVTVIFEDLFGPYVTRLAAGRDELGMTRVCAFLERMAGASDATAQDVLRVTMLRLISDDPDLRAALIPHMGPNARRLLNLVSKSL